MHHAAYAEFDAAVLLLKDFHNQRQARLVCLAVLD